MLSELEECAHLMVGVAVANTLHILKIRLSTHLGSNMLLLFFQQKEHIRSMFC